jgi:hypothetical protein
MRIGGERRRQLKGGGTIAATSVATDSHEWSAGAAQTTPDFTSAAVGAQAGHGELANETCFVKPNPLMLTLYPDATHDRDISEDPMVEEFAASLIGGRIVTWPSLERLLSPSALPQLQDEAPAVVAP